MKRMVSDVKSGKLAQELKDLETRSEDQLKDCWHSLYGMKPPQKIHRSLLIAAVAHRMQENALGALKPSVRRHLMQVANDTATSRPSPGDVSLRPRAGTLLVREWAASPIRQRCSKMGSSFAANDTSHFPRLHAS